jgi:tRNA(fMet)-specific endonuclease VapC
MEYLDQHSKLAVSALTVFEVRDGINRRGVAGDADQFLSVTVPQREVVYPDQEIITLAAKINASLVLTRYNVGVVDTLIAATAIAKNLVLVNANTRHFSRVQAAGFSLQLQDWRDV